MAPSVAHNARNDGKTPFLNFENKEHFPSFRELPERWEHLDHHWAIALEVVEPQLWIRPMYTMREPITKLEFTLAFYLDDPDSDKAHKLLSKFKPDRQSTVLIMYPRKHFFVDGQVGMRIEDEDLENIKVLNVHWPDFVIKNEEINYYATLSPEERLDGYCMGCDKGSCKLRCANCREPYCTRDCQQRDWKKHKRWCSTKGQLLAWRSFDWNVYDKPRPFAAA